MNEIVKEINQHFKNKYPDFKGIYFFGSRARGKFNSSSDYDFVFVFDRKINWQFEKEIVEQIYPFLLKHDIVIDPHIYSVSEIENPITPFRMNIKKEGIFYEVR